MIYHDTATDRTATFSSLSDFYSNWDQHVKNNSKYINSKLKCNYIDRNDNEFLGCTFAEAEQRRFGWKDGVKRLKELPPVMAPLSTKKIKYWSWVDGDTCNPDRYYNGMAPLRRRKKIAGHSKYGRVCKIVFTPANPWYVKPGQILNQCLTAARITDELESQGCRCELILHYVARSYDNATNKNFNVVITLKRAQDPLNIATLINAMSPWFMRIYLFSLQLTQAARPNQNCGYPKDIPVDQYKDDSAIIINRGQCLSLEEAKKFIENLNLEDD